MSKIKSIYIECYIYRKTSGGIKYLLLKRNIKDKIHPGIWQIITGKINKKEKAYQTALRELTEETGLKPFKLYSLPKVSSFYYKEKDTIHLIPLFLSEVKEEKIKLSEEHSEYKWLNFKSACRLVHWETQKENIRMINKMLNDRSLKATLALIV